jgi:hypothetical protein
MNSKKQVFKKLPVSLQMSYLSYQNDKDNTILRAQIVILP